jgi:calpain
MKPDLLPTDVVQGRLGDCWYISALSIVANNDNYIKGKKIKDNKSMSSEILTSGIHPPLFHFFTNYGLYVFKFFKKFKPVYVVVDDLFPV